MILETFRHALILSALLSVVPLVCASLVAGFVALLQAVTQLQEQTVLYLARLIVLMAVLVVGGEYACNELITLVQSSFESIGLVK